MSTKELQKCIIQKIRCINDIELLNTLSRLLCKEEEQKAYQLSRFEKNILAESKADYLTGKMIPKELQAILYSKILMVSDERQLFDLIRVIDQSNSNIYSTSVGQKAKVKEGLDQLAQGNYYTDEQVKTEIDEWLSTE